jgi:periplasmic protein TonB
MSYLDQSQRRNPASIAAVVGVHVAIGYALISGLATDVIRHVPIITVGQFLDDPPPPPAHEIPQVRMKPTPRSVSVPTKSTPDTLKVPDTLIRDTGAIDLGSPDGGGGGLVGPVDVPQPPKASLARDAVPGADRMRWITSDDYPIAALREEATGTVAIAATIGADGKVRSCEVTASSGSALLDQTTCRLYIRRAHFAPALDADGNPVAARRTDRFRWQIPN